MSLPQFVFSRERIDFASAEWSRGAIRAFSVSSFQSDRPTMGSLASQNLES
jgi:hypothetical protein